MFDWLAKYEWSVKFQDNNDRNKYIVTVIVISIVAFVGCRSINENFEYYYLVSYLELWIMLWFFFFLFRAWVFKVFARKNLKKEWWGVIIKAIIDDVIKDVNTDSDNNITKHYYAYAKDKEGNMYQTIDLYWLKYKKVNKSYLETLYQRYWFEYNEEKKSEVISEIRRKMNIVEKEKTHSNFFKKQKLSAELNDLERDKEAVEIGYYPAYFEFKNWNRLTVWDEVSVYVDPVDKNYYYVDVDKITGKDNED